MDDAGTPVEVRPAEPSGGMQPFVAGASAPPRKGFPVLQAAMAAIVIVAAGIGVYSWLSGARVAVQSEPPGATVLVNGRVVGATPVVVRGLSPGQYCLRMEKEGYTTLVRPLAVPREGLTIQETLAPIGTGALTVQIKPSGAEVLLDGEVVGHTPLPTLAVRVGTHDLVVRKTNFKSYVQRIEVQAGQPLEYKDFGLENLVLTMLRANVETEKQRVAHYMDLGHYLFVNDELDEAAEVYAQALQVANTALEFAKDTPVEERGMEQQRRAEDINRLNEEIRKKSHWPNKDVVKFASILRRQQDLVAGKNIMDWQSVRESVQNFIQDGKQERAQALLLQHIAAAPNTPNTPQAYIELLQLRLRMHSLEAAQETYGKFFDLYGGQPPLLRQAANSVYNAARLYQGVERSRVLEIAERMLRTSELLTRPGRGEPEMNSLCKFELANVLCLQGKPEAAVPLYRESIAGTANEPTKEARSQNLVDCLRTLNELKEVREILTKLSTSKTPEVAQKAKDDLQRLTPSPDNK
jgi:tetratricopeptide (TPR) repeat protein